MEDMRGRKRTLLIQFRLESGKFSNAAQKAIFDTRKLPHKLIAIP